LKCVEVKSVVESAYGKICRIHFLFRIVAEMEKLYRHCFLSFALGLAITDVKETRDGLELVGKY